LVISGEDESRCREPRKIIAAEWREWGWESGGAGFFLSFFLVHGEVSHFEELIEGFLGMGLGCDVAKAEAEKRLLPGAGVAVRHNLAETVDGDGDGGLAELTSNGELISADTAEDVGLSERGNEDLAGVGEDVGTD